MFSLDYTTRNNSVSDSGKLNNLPGDRGRRPAGEERELKIRQPQLAAPAIRPLPPQILALDRIDFVTGLHRLHTPGDLSRVASATENAARHPDRGAEVSRGRIRVGKANEALNAERRSQQIGR